MTVPFRRRHCPVSQIFVGCMQASPFGLAKSHGKRVARRTMAQFLFHMTIDGGLVPPANVGNAARRLPAIDLDGFEGEINGWIYVIGDSSDVCVILWSLHASTEAIVVVTMKQTPRDPCK